MFGAIREYKIQSGRAEELVERVRTEFVPIVERVPGFVGYSLTQVGSDGIVTTSTFETRAQAEESGKTAATWVKEHLATFMIASPRVTTGELVVRQIAENANAGYGVMRRFETKAADADTLTKQVREGLLPLLSGMPGFASYALLFEANRDRGASLSAFADRATAEAANQRALAWIKEHLGAKVIKPIEVVAGQIHVRQIKLAVAIH